MVCLYRLIPFASLFLHLILFVSLEKLKTLSQYLSPLGKECDENMLSHVLRAQNPTMSESDLSGTTSYTMSMIDTNGDGKIQWYCAATSCTAHGEPWAPPVLSPLCLAVLYIYARCKKVPVAGRNF